MTLTKPNQQLRHELKALGFDIEQAADEVLRITKDCRDVEVAAVLKLIAKLYEDADRDSLIMKNITILTICPYFATIALGACKAWIAAKHDLYRKRSVVGASPRVCTPYFESRVS